MVHHQLLIVEVSGLDFSVENYQTKISIRINALGILKNIVCLADKIFRFYPKRKNLFKDFLKWVQLGLFWENKIMLPLG